MQRNQKNATVVRMTLRGIALAAGVFGFAMISSTAQAAPASAANLIGGLDVLQFTDSDVTRVGGCHRGRRLHYVPRWGYRAWHRHRGRRCRPRQTGPRRGYYDPGYYHGPRYYRRNCVWVGPVRVCD